MTQADFYVLAGDDEPAYWRFISRLLLKIQHRQLKVHLHLDSAEAARAASSHLWGSEPTGFLPHSMPGDDDGTVEAITLGWDELDPPHSDVLLNFADALPEHFSRFDRLAIVANQEPVIRQRCRQHWAFLKHRGYPLKKHDV